MSLFIVVSQSFRLASTWATSAVTRKILISASIIVYTALLYQREQKITKYYAERAKDNTNRQPDPRSRKT